MSALRVLAILGGLRPSASRRLQWAFSVGLATLTSCGPHSTDFRGTWRDPANPDPVSGEVGVGDRTAIVVERHVEKRPVPVGGTPLAGGGRALEGTWKSQGARIAIDLGANGMICGELDGDTLTVSGRMANTTQSVCFESEFPRLRRLQRMPEGEGV